MQDANIRFFERGLQLVQASGDLKTALAQLVQLAAEQANSTSASFYVVDTKENVLKPLVTYGVPEAYVEACGDVRIGDQCCGRAVHYRKPWIVSDMLKDPMFESAKAAALVSPIRAGFSVPVIAQSGECLGALGCHYSEPYMPSAEQIGRNHNWAAMIADAICTYKESPGAHSAQGDPQVA